MYKGNIFTIDKTCRLISKIKKEVNNKNQD